MLHRSKHYVEPLHYVQTLNHSAIMFELRCIKETLQTRGISIDYGGPDLCFQIQFPGKKPMYGKVVFEQGDVHVRRTADQNGSIMLSLKKYRTVFHMVKVCRKKNVPLASRIFIRTSDGLTSLQTFFPRFY